MPILILSFITIYYIIAFVCLILTNYRETWKKFHVQAKTATSIGFIAIATVSGIVSRNMEFFKPMMIAFTFCLAGDVLLALMNHKNNMKYFILGLLSFLVGHIIFGVALNVLAPFSIKELIIPICFVAVAFFLLKIQYMEVGKMKVYVLVYSFFVAFLFSKGISVLLLGLTTSNIVIFLGATLFLISDAILLFVLFYQKKYYTPVFFNLLTYYLAQYLLAISIFLN